MIKKVWKFLTTYGVDEETLAGITPDLADTTLRYTRFFVLVCAVGVALGSISPLLMEKDPEKALVFLSICIPFLILFLVVNKLKEEIGVPLHTVETVTIIAMVLELLAHIYRQHIQSCA